ncbi:hypothetical protein CGLO_07601 [Colletotrichum gloeosporioides Cg-14]|uniref:Uncharacterized protein n=1 Tax=Colletotrichum gloeosporioides (strain Cg-14) TaxID=1237896 RepID=T0KBK3_COLGC|nr:hypothetical protein CGLO_07601 [Colletotrichum gloeosporioides Cg-14]
MAGLTSKSERL